ncbi:unnamed protein product [Prorocentrum cordatum]|uniref:Uncharacterized protein n=1 Tax=Prorocentrum cordatum TaxID=2364126 RepID=A0ABN9XQB4_9DINO|nr:unnamed protein product [Polarella glacialis]
MMAEASKERQSPAEASAMRQDELLGMVAQMASDASAGHRAGASGFPREGPEAGGGRPREGRRPQPRGPLGFFDYRAGGINNSWLVFRAANSIILLSLFALICSVRGYSLALSTHPHLYTRPVSRLGHQRGTHGGSSSIAAGSDCSALRPWPFQGREVVLRPRRTAPTVCHLLCFARVVAPVPACSKRFTAAPLLGGVQNCELKNPLQPLRSYLSVRGSSLA